MSCNTPVLCSGFSTLEFRQALYIHHELMLNVHSMLFCHGEGMFIMPQKSSIAVKPLPISLKGTIALLLTWNSDGLAFLIYTTSDE